MQIQIMNKKEEIWLRICRTQFFSIRKHFVIGQGAFNELDTTSCSLLCICWLNAGNFTQTPLLIIDYTKHLHIKNLYDIQYSLA